MFDGFVCFSLCASLDPDGDPLCMLLLIDFLSLRSREYHFLLRLYQEWEVRQFHARVSVCTDLYACELKGNLLPV